MVPQTRKSADTVGHSEALNEVQKNVMIDLDRGHYASFFDHQWADRILTLARGTRFEEVVFDLTLAWREAANTHVLPWVMVRSLKSFAIGLTSSVPVAPVKTFELASSRIAEDMLRRGADLSPMQVKALEASIQYMHRQAEQLCSSFELPFDEDDVWNSFAEVSEFQFSLRGSQRLCYGAIYFAYEDFLFSTFKLAIGRSREAQVTARGGEPWPEFEKELGVHTHNKCWSDSGVDVARLVRNALVHNGARVTKVLAARDHQLCIHDGHIQILPLQNAALFNLLKDRAVVALEAALERSQLVNT